MSYGASLSAISPILIVLCTGMFVLLADSCVPIWRRYKPLSAVTSLIGIAVAAWYSYHLLDNGPIGQIFNGAIIADAFTQSCGLLLLVTAALAVLLAVTYLENRQLHLGEYYALVLFSTAGSMLMAATNDLIMLFVALETLSVALYVLAGFARTQERSEEAALKYFLLGAFAAGFLLYGIALIYGGSAGAASFAHGATSGAGNGGSTNLTVLAAYLHITAPSGMLMTGVALLLVGLGFKAALVPFHMWTPDVYEGAPTSVTAYMAAGAKIAAFAALLRVLSGLLPISGYWLIPIQILAIITMFGGNLIAITQENVKRMLAYSSIAHAGYLMVALSAMTSTNPVARTSAVSAITFYLLAYSLMTMGAFAVLIWVSRRGRDIQTLADLKGLGKHDPAAAYVMLVFMLSLGGIPPTMGFLGKWFIFAATVQAGQLWLALLLAVASMISIYYYLKIVWMMCFQEPEGDAVVPRALSPTGVFVSIAITVGATLLFGFVPNLVSVLTNSAATMPHP
ncbi:MAG TPA: NADH-quinone oxidoreductase subunit N [Chthonomonadaceae bacterium]|nr:NADH-quinone oxidoreductase subunit N [Chthonomonadaceae bacterium]